MSDKPLRLIALLATFLALFVVMLGAYTRLTDAGLGCPDWPGCYGRLVLPHTQPELSKVQQQFPIQPIETRKAWTEMAHRYAAGALVLLVLFLTINSFYSRHSLPRVLPLLILCLMGLQAALGMWTVTWKLLPSIVMGHLLGGMLIFTLLSYLFWRLSSKPRFPLPTWRVACNVGLVLTFCQIALGGWVSSNYAGIACVGFPQCNGQWLPPLDFIHGFNIFTPIGLNYQGGLLHNAARITIQMIHRFGAVIVAGYVLILALLMLSRVKIRVLQRLAIVAIMTVLIQFSLGVINVVYLLPLWDAVAHNGVAAILLATLASMRYFTSGEGGNAR